MNSFHTLQYGFYLYLYHLELPLLLVTTIAFSVHCIRAAVMEEMIAPLVYMNIMSTCLLIRHYLLLLLQDTILGPARKVRITTLLPEKRVAGMESTVTSHYTRQPNQLEPQKNLDDRRTDEPSKRINHSGTSSSVISALHCLKCS